MKAVVEFDLNNQEDITYHKVFMKSSDMANAIFEFANNSKDVLVQVVENRAEREMYLSNEDTIDLVFQKFFDILEEHNINIDELIR